MKFNVGAFLEGIAVSQAGAAAGKAAGLQARQEMDRQKQLMEMQKQDQEMQRQAFDLRRQQFMADSEDRKRQQNRQALTDRLAVLDPNSEEYRKTQAEIAGMEYQLPTPAMPFGPMAQNFLGQTGQPQPGQTPLNDQPPPLPTGTPAQPVLQQYAPQPVQPARSPFKQDTSQYAGVRARAQALWTQAAEDKDIQDALGVYLTDLETGKLGSPQEAAQQLNQITQGLAARGAAKQEFTSAKPSYERLDEVIKGTGQFRVRPQLMEVARSLQSQFDMISPTSPTSVEDYRKWKVAVADFLKKNENFEAGNSEVDRQAKQTAAEALQEAKSQREAEVTNQRKLDAIAKASGMDKVNAILDQVRYAEQNAKYGLRPVGEGRYDTALRKVPTVGGDAASLVPGIPGIGVNAALQTLGARQPGPMRDEFPEERAARILQQVAEDAESDPKTRQKSLQEALRLQKSLLTGSRWGEMDAATQESIVEGIRSLQEQMGLPPNAILPPGFKADQLPPIARKRFEIDNRNYLFEREKFEEIKRKNREQERRLNEKTDKPGAMPAQAQEIARMYRSEYLKKVSANEAMRRQAKAEGFVFDEDAAKAEETALKEQWRQAVESGVTVTDKPNASTIAKKLPGTPRERYLGQLKAAGASPTAISKLMKAWDAKNKGR